MIHTWLHGGLTRTVAVLSLLSAATVGQVEAADWQPAKGRLTTRWTKDVSPERVHPEYPRPQLVRKEWLNLNGLWDYAIVDKKESEPKEFQGKILVPFPVESALSGVMKPLGAQQQLWYRRKFTVPAGWAKKIVLLHFGAVDWETTVYLNGKKLDTHRGGYDGFTVNLTPALSASGPQELVVAVWDPTDAGTQPRGKQIRKPNGIWYTSTSGIWQTVWIEPVGDVSVDSLKIVPDVDASALQLTVNIRGDDDGVAVRAVALDGGVTAGTATGRPGELLRIPLGSPKLWSPDSPHLYQLKVELTEDGESLDAAESYFGMRKISLGKDEKGAVRLFLNNQPLFHFGPLDQGFWPDGLYTAPTDEALRYDIEVTKQLGFNMARKHVKIEPARWYYWCDKLGLLVWQDMPSGDRYIGPKDPDIKRSEESARQFELEYQRLIDGRGNHPSIVMWVPFNEGWGQYDTARIAAWTRQYDPSRLVNSVSGWADRGVGDVLDIHVYPGPAAPPPALPRAGVLGEYGGLGLPVPGHTWQDEKNWGYRSFKTADELTAAYTNLIRKLRPLTGGPGLAAAVYTQTTDVEIEVNGLLTYDRSLIKIKSTTLADANRKVYLPPPPPPLIQVLSPTAQEKPIEWRYTTNQPVAIWMHPDFEDSGWEMRPAGFGEPTTPGAIVRTAWKTSDIWLRRPFTLRPDFKLQSLQLLIHHDEDAKIYVNGREVASLEGHTSAYDFVILDARIKDALHPGKNILAVHCRQTRGGQYIDVGLLDVIDQEASVR